MVVSVGPSKINVRALLSSSLMALISAKTRAICCQTAGGQKLKKWICTTDVKMMLTWYGNISQIILPKKVGWTYSKKSKIGQK